MQAAQVEERSVNSPPAAAQTVRGRWKLLLTNSERILFVVVRQNYLKAQLKDEAWRRQVVAAEPADLHPSAAAGRTDTITEER